MIKQAPTRLQMFALISFVLACGGVLLYLWLSFGGVLPVKPEGYRFHARFPEATQLAIQSDVRISGVPVGKVVAIDTAPGNRTDATIELESQYAPIPADARVMLRQKTLLGETYVDLTPGNKGKGSLQDTSGKALEDGGLLANSAVEPTVELDEIFRTFDKDTQEAFRTWMQSQAGAVEGRGADINAFFGNLPGFVGSADDLMEELYAQSDAVSGTIRDTGVFFSAISERDGQLARLINASNRFFSVTAERNQDFADIWREFPRFERESQKVLPRLTQFAEVADPVVKDFQPTATEMALTFKQLDRLAPTWKTFFTGLGPLITASNKGVPALEELMKDFPPLLDAFQPFLRNFNPMLGYFGQNRREITAFFANTTAASLAGDLILPRAFGKKVHYLRTTQPLSPESLSYYPQAPGFSRNNAYSAPNAMDRLRTGLASFETRSCSNGNPAPPASADPEQLVPLVPIYVFRTTGRDIAAPPCFGQGNYPGFNTQFPQLRAEP